MHYWLARSFGVTAALLIVAAVLAYAFDLVFVPPAAEAAAWQAPHWRAYAWAWQWAEQLGRTGLSQGFFPSTIRQFDDSGLPAYLPWAALAAGAAALAVLSMLVMMFLGGRMAGSHDSPREPSLAADDGSLEDVALSGAPLPIPPTSIRAAPSLIREPSVARASAPAPAPASAPAPTPPSVAGRPGLPMGSGEFARRLEASLYESEQALGAAMTSLEDVRRASLNLVLDPAVAQANQDLQEIHDALDELEIAFEQLRGQQHALMADLVQLDGQPAAR
jgi:hypothetical protein